MRSPKSRRIQWLFSLHLHPDCQTQWKANSTSSPITSTNLRAGPQRNSTTTLPVSRGPAFLPSPSSLRSRLKTHWLLSAQHTHLGADGWELRPPPSSPNLPYFCWNPPITTGQMSCQRQLLRTYLVTWFSTKESRQVNKERIAFQQKLQETTGHSYAPKTPKWNSAYS